MDIAIALIADKAPIKKKKAPTKKMVTKKKSKVKK
jgi:hypothetical protein